MNSSESKSAATVIENSPIEFVISGPKGEGDGVLFRSDHAGLDLIGACSDGLKAETDFQFLSWYGILLRTKYRPISVVCSSPAQVSQNISVVYSSPLAVNQTSEDSRLGSFTFSWIGESSPEERQEIEKQFNRRSTDIGKAIAAGDKERLEWYLGPVIRLCVECDSKHLVSKLILLLFLLILIIFVALWMFGKVAARGAL